MNPALLTLKRNDLESALKIRRAGIAEGNWCKEDDVVLCRLQDDPFDALDRLSAEDVRKALPRLSDDDREAKSKKVGAKPLKAATKQVGSGGKVRYGYPGEKGGDKKPSKKKSGAAPKKDQAMRDKRAADAELPHPDLPSPEPDQAPVLAEHPDAPDKQDTRAPDPTQPQPQHTVNIGELCSALKLDRKSLDRIATDIQAKNGENARPKFIAFMRTHLREFAEEHGLDGDYFGLVFDVLTKKVPEGQSSSEQQGTGKPTVAPKPGPM